MAAQKSAPSHSGGEASLENSDSASDFEDVGVVDDDNNVDPCLVNRMTRRGLVRQRLHRVAQFV